MDISYRHALAAGAALLVSQGGSETASAATELRTTTTSQSGASLDVLFAPVPDATELVSVSDGSVFTGEGGSLVVSAITDGNQIIPLTGSIFGGFSITRSLFDMTQDDFTAFPAQTITGIRFTMSGFDSRSVTIPSGTQFTFTTIPEPQAALLIGLGLLGLAARGARPSL
jgi:hypothetical protein